MTRRHGTSSGPGSQRGFALLLTLLVLTVMSILVSQMVTSVAVSRNKVFSRLRERKCRRALDSALGLAMRMLTEQGADLAVDTLGDDWCRPKYFEIGDVRVEIRIEDCARYYDLKPLLEEEPEALEDNREQFVTFATASGVPNDVASRLAEAIIQEAEVRRAEDMVIAETTPELVAPTDRYAVPIWLEDFLSLPQLTDEDRRAIRFAATLLEDPETFAQFTVKFLDLVTIWRKEQLNINTAGAEVLRYSLPGLADNPDAVEQILSEREEEPFQNVSQIAAIAGIPQDQASQISRLARINSARFRVTATAKLMNEKPTFPMIEPKMVMILERSGMTFKTLWRHTNV